MDHIWDTFRYLLFLLKYCKFFFTELFGSLFNSGDQVTDLRPHLVSSLKTALETRLLHPGVNTTEILTFYIEAIRALRFLDPSGKDTALCKSALVKPHPGGFITIMTR